MNRTIGLNIEFAEADNRQLALDRIRALDPLACLTYGVTDGLALRDAGVTYPIVRHWPDGGVNTSLTADQWMRKYEGVANAGLWIEATNEDGIPIDWLCNPQTGILPAALKRGWKIFAPGMQTGIPTVPEYPKMLPFFELCAQFPDQLGFSFHDYYWPTPNIGMAKNTTVLQAAEWSPSYPLPAIDRANGLRWWYAGRQLDFALNLCDERGLPRPKIICCTELGLCVSADPHIAIPGNTSYPGGLGWMSWRDFFEQLWPEQTAAQTYAQQIIWLAENVYEPSGAMVCVYCYGAKTPQEKKIPPGSSQDWTPFHVEDETIIFDEWTAYAQSGSEANVNPNFVTVTLAPIGDFANVRTEPSTAGGDATVAYKITAPTTFLLDTTRTTPDKNYPALSWQAVRTSNNATVFWVRSDAVKDAPPAVGGLDRVAIAEYVKSQKVALATATATNDALLTLVNS